MRANVCPIWVYSKFIICYQIVTFYREVEVAYAFGRRQDLGRWKIFVNSFTMLTM